MSQKIIFPGDICRIRHNESGHYFEINTLVVIKECFPKFSAYPTKFKACTRTMCWYVGVEDVTLFKRNDKNKNQ